LPIPGQRAAFGPPRHLRIPAIGVDADLGNVGLQSDGTIEVPSDWDRPARYRQGPTPGDQRPAVIVGHLDSYTGPAVFWNLASLQPGARIDIIAADGSEIHFRVRDIEVYPRSQFPTGRVYGPVPGAELRLITCGGSYSPTSLSYTSNVVVFAAAVIGD
jgi:hypothetical protein